MQGSWRGPREVDRRRSKQRRRVIAVISRIRHSGRGEEDRASRQFAKFRLLSRVRTVLAELVPDDGTSVGDECFDDAALQGQGKIQVRPRLVAILEGW